MIEHDPTNPSKLNQIYQAHWGIVTSTIGNEMLWHLRTVLLAGCCTKTRSANSMHFAVGQKLGNAAVKEFNIDQNSFPQVLLTFFPGLKKLRRPRDVALIRAITKV